MNHDREIARVQVWDVDVPENPRSAGGALRSREPGDWYAAAVPMFVRRRRRRAGATGGEIPQVIRFEWVGDAAQVADLADVAEPAGSVAVIVDNGEGLLRITLELGDAGPVATRFEFVGTNAMLTTQRLRRAGFGAALKTAEQALRGNRVPRILGRPWRRDVQRPGRSGRPDSFYAEAAARYVRALQEAPRRPVAWLVDEHASRGEHVTAAQLRATLNKARNRGLLTDSPDGRAGGSLTAKARRVLARAGIDVDLGEE